MNPQSCGFPLPLFKFVALMHSHAHYSCSFYVQLGKRGEERRNKEKGERERERNTHTHIHK